MTREAIENLISQADEQPTIQEREMLALPLKSARPDTFILTDGSPWVEPFFRLAEEDNETWFIADTYVHYEPEYQRSRFFNTIRDLMLAGF